VILGEGLRPLFLFCLKFICRIKIRAVVLPYPNT
jgi:hypothetical protein